MMNSNKYLLTVVVTVFAFCALFGNQNVLAAESSTNSVQPREATPALLQELKVATPALLQELKAYPHKLVYETHRDGNWEIYLVNADGTNPKNLTRTPEADELYPKASPDGARICFVADEGKGEARSRNLYLMNIDGSQRRKIADNAREPAWSADGNSIAYLPGEFKRFAFEDYATKGIVVLNLKTGQTREHPNPALQHLYCLNWSPDGKWFVATVHGGMGFGHNIIAIEANGTNLYNLSSINGCRPDLNTEWKKIAWGREDYTIGVADIDFSLPIPKVLDSGHCVMQARKLPIENRETYHADWSPDSRYIAFSFGLPVEGAHKGKLPPELPGAEAPGWNICVADATQTNRFVLITVDGASCKEPDWVYIRPGAGK